MNVLSDDEGRDLILSVGVHRSQRRLSPVEVGILLAKELTVTPISILAEEINLTPSMINRFVDLLTLPEDIRDLVDWGEKGGLLSFTAASYAAKLPTDVSKEVAAKLLRRELRASDAKMIVSLVRKGVSSEDAITQVLALRPKLVTIHLLIGGVTDLRVRGILQEKSQAERDSLFKALLSSHYPALEIRACRLGVTRFTILTSEQGKAEIDLIAAQRSTDFEKLFRSELGQCLLGDEGG